MKKLVLSLLIIISFCSLAYAQKTIEPELQNVMNQKDDDMISVNIILKSNIDMNRLRSRAEQITDKKVKRDFLVDEMKLFAEKEQAEILSVLRAEEKSDRVSNIKSSWMSNYINCTASRDVIYLIAEHPDVLMIGYDEEKYMLWNEKAEKVEHGKDNITENITIERDNLAERIIETEAEIAKFGKVRMGAPVNEDIFNENISLIPCAYLHNYEEKYKDEIYHPKYSEAIEAAPIFSPDGRDLKANEYIYDNIRCKYYGRNAPCNFRCRSQYSFMFA